MIFYKGGRSKQVLPAVETPILEAGNDGSETKRHGSSCAHSNLEADLNQRREMIHSHPRVSGRRGHPAMIFETFYLDTGSDVASHILRLYRLRIHK